MTRVLASVSAEYPAAGMAELRRAAAVDGATVTRLGPDLVAVDGNGVTATRLAGLARAADLVFCKHLATVVGSVEPSDLVSVDTAAAAADRLLVAAGALSVDRLAVQAWASGAPTLPFTPGALAAALTRRLEAAGRLVAPAGQQWTAALVMCGQDILVGWTRARDCLSDWPGGRVRLARRSEQVSRAEFKLEELFKTDAVELPRRGQALDLGASPGGWTRILRARGLDVTAVDPGDLAPALARDRRVRHVRTTAGRFLRASSDRFDVIVNDMRMAPAQSVKTMLDARRAVRTGGLMVMTLKLGVVTSPAAMVHRSLTSLAGDYDVVFARQLHHNRHEITIAARPRGR